MSEPEKVTIPMRRGIDLVGLEFDDNGRPVVQAFCDCGVETHITLEDFLNREDRPPILEFAYTCDGCGTSHWLTVGTGRTP